MASNEQIQQAINAATNAGAAHGYAQALEDVVGNLDLMISKLDPDVTGVTSEPDPTRIVQGAAARVIRANIAPELEKRKALAERELRLATVIQAQLRANSPTWQVALARRIIDASRLRPLLVQALGGADSRRPAQ